MISQEEIDALVAQYQKHESYKEIEGKNYIQDFAGFAELNAKYNLINHNAELYNYFKLYFGMMSGVRNPTSIQETLASMNLNTYENISKFVSSLTDTRKYALLIKVHMNKDNLPPELKTKPLILIHKGEFFNLL